MAEYGMSLHAAVWRFPLRAALALVHPRRDRAGVSSSGPTPANMAALAARAAEKDRLAGIFAIVPSLPEPS
jgi:hypothetical protein